MSASDPTPVPKRGSAPRFEVNEQLEVAARLFRTYLLKCLPLSMVAVLAASASELYLNMTGQATLTAKGGATVIKLPTDPVYWVLDIAGTLLSVLLVCTVMLRLQALRAGKHPAVMENLRAATARWLPAAGTTLLSLLAVGIGLVALIVPGIYLAVCLVVVLPVILFEPVDPITALVRSFRLVRPLWVKVLACVLISGFVGFVCLLALSAILGLLFGAVQDNHLVNAVLQAIVLAFLATFYVFVASLSLTIYTAASSSA
jgi:hypothetical protein